MAISAFSLVLPIPLASVIVLAYWSFLRWLNPLTRLPYPPGPPVKSLISGNAEDVPQTQPWLTYIEWGKKYASDVVHFRIYGQHTVIVNSYEENVELLEKRSNIYSDRPHIAMVELMGWDFNSAFLYYGSKWRSHRRLYQKMLKPEASLNYQPIQTRKVHDFLHSLLTTPGDFRDHNRTLAAAIIMSAMYGHDIAPTNDYYVQLAEAAVAKLSESVFPGAQAVNAIPILRHLPAWFPGAGFKRFGNVTSELTRQMREVPIMALKKQMEAGNAPECRAAELLATCETQKELDAITCVISTSYAGGADTTVSAVATFFLAMVTCPDVQRKAQAELDSVVGKDGLVTYDDRSSLSYVEALYREVLRWRPVLPLSVSHATSDDDFYKGYYIPKGTTVISNVWAIAHNPQKYPEPNKFNPDRFFKDDGELNNDESLYVFGFGRRNCPGRHMASASVWLTIASVLQNFNISTKKDASGTEIPVDGKYTEGLLSHPLPFECTITPRHETAKQIILEAVRK